MFPETVDEMREVFARLMEWMENPATFGDSKEEEVSYVASEFNRFLDRMVSEDFFGTEGQNDPRCDNRDNPPAEAGDGGE